MRFGLVELLTLPITAPGALLGAIYFLLTGRMPKTWVILALGIAVVAGVALAGFAMLG